MRAFAGGPAARRRLADLDTPGILLPGLPEQFGFSTIAKGGRNPVA
jgi:hypothetical protein